MLTKAPVRLAVAKSEQNFGNWREVENMGLSRCVHRITCQEGRKSLPQAKVKENLNLGMES
jgi:hypothetical protein